MDIRIGAAPSVDYIPNSKSLTTVKPATTEAFESFFNAAVDIVKETNQFQLNANALSTDLAAGRTDDLVAVLLAQDRATSSINFTVQVTNKIIESYREIMRMQI